jgi:hypothetical protein
MFAAWIFYGMTVVGLLIFRGKAARTGAALPDVGILFAAVSFWFVGNTAEEVSRRRSLH